MRTTWPTLRRREVALGLAVAACLPGVASAAARNRLEPLAAFDRSPVQVAVTPGGRVFVNFSRWFGPVPVAVAEIVDGAPRPYPDAAFNGTVGPAVARAVAVQSVVPGSGGRSLWMVDAGNPALSGPVPGGAKLVEVDLATDRVRRVLPLGPDVAPAGSYLADLRFSADGRFGLLPDLALGAIAVVELATGRGRRVLADHPSTRAEDMLLRFAGKPWLLPDGSRPRTAVTGVAVSPDGRTFYFKPLVGRTLYTVPVGALLDPAADAGAQVRPAVAAHPSDAIAFAPHGALYLTAIDRAAITRWRPGERAVTTVVADARLAWPVGLAFDGQGRGYTTVGRINEGTRPADRYRLYRFDPTGA